MSHPPCTVLTYTAVVRGRPGTPWRTHGDSNGEVRRRRREGHDASPYYGRSLVSVEESSNKIVQSTEVGDSLFLHSAEEMAELPDNSVALMITSPPYHVGKDYDSDATFF